MKNLVKTLLLAGPLAFAAFPVVVYFSASSNPWWSLYKHAFSDLGGPRAANPWIFNYGLMAMGLLVVVYSFGVLLASKTKYESFAAGLLFVAGVFLFLIGYYPSGTKPHTFVSLWFYLQSFIASTALGIALLLSGRKAVGTALLALGLVPVPLGTLIEATVGWPSVAILELAGALFIGASAIVATLHYIREA
ncbi:DUF998 domain-containing protein [Thermofilum pendens]|uniref:DUF998 domain-containing protein n=1 Tax=Thermofilum pendens (strain DSM 2475 / Hrk 5) TaxID=368408 RepID=A1RZ19_THEPD|nr:DUF998 domain-containing protein [Thermofilum pendens]ABL78449.1 Protein of unknown function DUF998 [Thermofilum pendens Hrk 5]